MLDPCRHWGDPRNTDVHTLNASSRHGRVAGERLFTWVGLVEASGDEEYG